ncbi:hypothetical protein E0485_05825 [Paenibacillus albiflavus]|uniref:Uncharacterized protein n=1 Tax=Paenibacillus albiflavus TaxID=2545760 RepID=A0A4R4EHP1_9BACL|nr:hypothetical protein [Paenibacillus albiflavus]TCZ79379.1 hypothetical protein E0485_05825 [Paenibacillus albiflavus]
MKDKLEILEEAISDVGFWSWWTEKLPEAFQLEFGGTHIWSPPRSSDTAPSGQVALRFGNPRSICFLRRSSSNLPENWADLLKADQLEPFSIDYGDFKFNNPNYLNEILNSNVILEKKFGEDPNLYINNSDIFSLCFMAGEVGFIIIAEELRILNHTGDINLNDIDSLVSRWWEYWKEYWELKNTLNELPKDYACEVTIPLKADQ